MKFRSFKISPSDRRTKRFKAVFVAQDGSTRVVHFGQEGGSTFIDHGDHDKRRGYIARHGATQDWSRPDTAGSLSRFLLWEHTSPHEAIEAYAKRYSRFFVR